MLYFSKTHFNKIRWSHAFCKSHRRSHFVDFKVCSHTFLCIALTCQTRILNWRKYFNDVFNINKCVPQHTIQIEFGRLPNWVRKKMSANTRKTISKEKQEAIKQFLTSYSSTRTVCIRIAYRDVYGWMYLLMLLLLFRFHDLYSFFTHISHFGFSST